MEVSNDKLREYTRRMMIARMRLLCKNGFYGLLLMHVKMNLSYEKETAWSDFTEKLYFNPNFLEQISDRELDYVLMHLILHIALKHLQRKGDYEDICYEQAADIVVNSNILQANCGDLDSISLDAFGGVQPHLVPGGREGFLYSVEEVYQMLKQHVLEENIDSGWDDHTLSRENQEGDGDGIFQDRLWQERIMQATAAMQKRMDLKSAGQIPAFAKRYLEELKKPQVDWRTVLDEFIQEEINDYSFCPPDRRFDDSPFFLPDFNEKDYRVEKILFMIDTSASMSDSQITQCYSEIKGAMDQFDGKLEGWVGFFDAAVVEPKPFMDVSDFMKICPEGGGGTRFDIIFEYVMEKMADTPLVSIVILTDGEAIFPAEKETQGIPVLWIINNETVTPPWGKVARIRGDC